jgi:general secretion pathway protein H
VLFVVGIGAVLMVGSVYGFSAITTARLRRGAVMIASAVRIAYAHSNATGKTVRLVFDFERKLVALEEASTILAVKRGERTGGAEAATETEKKAVEEADKIMKGPQKPRPAFRPTKAFGFNADAGKPGRELPSGIRFAQVETAHDDLPSTSQRAYLYFWPGGQTERASIQLTKSRLDPTERPERLDERDVMTILIAPLTGKSDIRLGKFLMPRPRDDREDSDRVDSGGY